MKKLSHGFAIPIILIIIGLIVGAGAVFAYFQVYSKPYCLEHYCNEPSSPIDQSSPITNTSYYTNSNLDIRKDPSGWNIYTNHFYDYSIKYPADWKIVIRTEKAELVLLHDPRFGDSYGEFEKGPYVEIYGDFEGGYGSAALGCNNPRDNIKNIKLQINGATNASKTVYSCGENNSVNLIDLVFTRNNKVTLLEGYPKGQSPTLVEKIIDSFALQT